MNQHLELFSSINIRDLKLKNRIVMSPMCQYSSDEKGNINGWHQVHYATRAIGGVGLIMVEATAISPRGRISNKDLGIWNDEHVSGHFQLCQLIKNSGAAIGIQLAHSGRKSNESILETPWAPSEISFDMNYKKPKAINEAEMKLVINDFVSATLRALRADYDIIELHMAHGYLLNEFLSPLCNFREDQYGGSIENRMRFPLEVVERVRDVWPSSRPLFVRISATDWMDDANGWSLSDSIVFCNELTKRGVDLIDCSSGGAVSKANIYINAQYQVPFASQIKKQVQIRTGAVGLITDGEVAEDILKKQDADLIFLGRELLRNPYWAINTSQKLKNPVLVPKPYERAYDF